MGECSFCVETSALLIVLIINYETCQRAASDDRFMKKKLLQRNLINNPSKYLSTLYYQLNTLLSVI